MSLVISLLLLWMGVGQPTEVADHLETVVFEHESAGDPDADNPRSSATGLFQILASSWAPHFGVSEAQLYDPLINARLAREILDIQGWRAWTTYRLCR